MNKRLRYIIEYFCNGNIYLFCSKTKINSSTLYSILNENRFNPTMDFFFKIKSAYSEVNLNWLIYDEQPVFMKNIKILKKENDSLQIELKKKNILIEFLKQQ